MLFTRTLCTWARAAALSLALVALASVGQAGAAPQEFGNSDRDRGRTMLNVIKKDLQKHYYDPAIRGIDVEGRFKVAEERISKAQSNGEVFAIIAQVLIELKDSHTRFYPPARSVDVKYGYELCMIGDECYVVALRPGSDADKKLDVGDRVLAVDGRTPTRATMWMMGYLYYTLRPQPSIKLAVQSPGAEPRQVEVVAEVTQRPKLLDLTNNIAINDLLRDIVKESRLTRHRYVEIGEDALIWQMPQFDLDERDVDRMVDRAKGRGALIIDMRGNGGGAETTMLRLIGNLVDRDVTVGTIKRRSETKPLLAETRGADKVYKGKVVVLVDSRSASAAEVVARVLQIEKRATVVGDRSSGAVMRSRYHSHGYGSGTSVFYGVSITDADLVMTDGKSLEHEGVVPDESLLPKAEDMAAGLDTALTRAAEIAGFQLSPKRAGDMFPVEWE